MELARELEASLREFAAAAPVEVRENGGRVAPLAALSWEVRGAAEKPLLHLWSAEYNLTRRVLAITDYSYLLAPALRFHPATEELLRYLAPEVEIVRVGLAESWRRGVRVVMRQ